uniref:Bromo domain-containing protein n=1 Tax=Ditylenchus dipsaci TaxID=166011 RepID=A0A915D6N2_9BILA
MNMSISAGVYGGRAVSENRIKFSSSRTAGKHSSRRSTSRHGGRHTHRRRHGSSDSSSTSSSSSDAESGNRPSGIKSAKQDARQEARFERRKLKSLAKGRRNLMPMNLTEKEIASSSMSSREKLRKLGSSCADIDPMQIDNKVGFEQIGGLTKHIQSLKEQFDVSPPKGVLFYGPPGTGKTLVARALANECSKDGQKVAFFMRKGADCLSKWVGESERQLRLLFDQAYAMRPSIIFFDEIDGLAPVRSSKQDQIHSSIVSTLLALMDGLDKRGEVIVIGATNRLDSIDPALRRPGRFDREMRFDLPDKTAREAILKIHTSSWKECQPDEQVLQWLADQSSGYCGADLRALCTEAVLVALRESFPHIYLSAEKLLIDPSKVKITRQHFLDSLRQIVPASRRDMSVVSHQLNERSGCLIKDFIESTMTTKVPKGYLQRTNCVQNLYKTDLERVVMGLKTPPSVPAARLLLHGHGQLGQSTHHLPVLLNRLDHLPVVSLSSESIYSSGSPEENVSQAIRTIVAVDVLVERIQWSDTRAFASLFTTTLYLLPEDIKQLFRNQNTVEVKCPTEPQRKTYYKKLLDKAMESPVEFNAALYPLPEKAPKDVPIRRVSDKEYKELRNTYNQMLRQLRMFLRDILARLVRDRRFSAFQLPVDKDDAEDYYEIIEKPMCLTQMMSKIDAKSMKKWNPSWKTST